MYSMLKRCIRKLKYYRGKTILLLMFFVAVFLMLFLVLVSYDAVKQEIKNAEKNVGKSVCIYKRWKSGQNDLDEVWETMMDSEIQGMASHQTVVDENVFLTGEKKYLGETYPMVGMDNSERSMFFSAFGFHMLEGKGIDSSNDHDNVVLISQQFAQKKGLKIGDSLTLSSCDKEKRACGERSIKVEVIGLYAADPIAGDSREEGSEILFLPYKALEKAYFATAGAFVLQLYFDDIPSLKEYLEDFCARYDTTGKGLHYYKYYWNEEGYQKIVEPLKDMLRLCQALMVIVGIGIAGILWNIGALSLKNNKTEFAILLSYGEKLRNILLQNILETVLPMLCAMVIAFILSFAASGRVVDQLNDIYMQNQEEISRIVQSKNVRDMLNNTGPNRVLFSPNMGDFRVQPIEKSEMNLQWCVGILAALLVLASGVLYLQSWLYLRRKKVRGILQKE